MQHVHHHNFRRSGQRGCQCRVDAGRAVGRGLSALPSEEWHGVLFGNGHSNDESDEDDCIQVSAHRAAIGWAIFLQAGKLAATIIAWIAIQKAKGLFANANECTDAISASMGFADINSAVNTANDNTIGNWVLEALLLVYNIYSICTARAFNEDEVLDQAATDLAEAEAEDKESAVMEMGDNDEYKAQVESGGPI